MRFQPGEVLFGKEIKRPRQTLAAQAKMVIGAIDECTLEQPSGSHIKKALEGYRLFSDVEMGAVAILGLPSDWPVNSPVGD